MKKRLATILCGALVASVAVPALAESTISGYFRTQMLADNCYQAKPLKDAQGEDFTIQRIRMKWTNKINDNVTVVWFGEADSKWGVNEGASDNASNVTKSRFDGALGADGINLETKNAYATIKVPGATDLSFTVGQQTVTDNLNGIYFNHDVAAVTAMTSMNNIGLTLGWMTKAEGVTRNNGATLDPNINVSATNEAMNQNKDDDIYFALAKVKANDTTNFGVNLFIDSIQDTGAVPRNATAAKKTPATIYTLGLFGDMKMNNIKVDGVLAYQGGSMETAGSTVNKGALALTVGAEMAIDKASVGARVIWYGSDDDASDTKDGIFSGNMGNAAYMNENQAIFLADAGKTEQPANDQKAILGVANSGWGLTAIVLKGKMPLSETSFAKAGFGYYMAGTDKIGTTKKEGTSLGMEIDVEVGTKIDVATLSLRCAYAMLGNFYDYKVGSKVESPDALYLVGLTLNVPY